jgi:biopolymer transport protein ExbB/TolQ
VSRITSFAEWILRLPILWGGIAALAFYAMLSQHWINSPLLEQYMAGHRVEYIVGTMFFVGFTAVVMRLLEVAGQFGTLKLDLLDRVPSAGESVGNCDLLLEQLAAVPRRMQESYLVRRLREALEFVCRKNSANGLDQHLRHLEELDAFRMQNAYTIVRIIIWAIPILGLLGTVIGITMAVANLNPQTLEESTAKVTAGLGVAFDHTAEALALTMILMFAKSFVERLETRLLSAVDGRASEELVGRFEATGAGVDPNVAVVRRMSEQVLDAVENLVKRQAEIWRSTIHAAHQQWADINESTGRVIQDSLASSLRDSLSHHAVLLNDSVSKHADHLSSSAAAHAEQLQRSTDDSTTRLHDGLEKLAELLVEALHKHGEVLIASEKEIASENRQHLSEMEDALSRSMVVAAERQEDLIQQSENLLKEMQVALVEAAEATVRQQEQLVKQGDVLLRVVDSTNQIQKLEQSLNQNVAAIERACDFEDVALNLSAAIQLLSVRLGHPPASARAREVAGDDSANRAA